MGRPLRLCCNVCAADSCIIEPSCAPPHLGPWLPTARGQQPPHAIRGRRLETAAICTCSRRCLSPPVCSDADALRAMLQEPCHLVGLCTPPTLCSRYAARPAHHLAQPPHGLQRSMPAACCDLVATHNFMKHCCTPTCICLPIILCMPPMQSDHARRCTSRMALHVVDLAPRNPWRGQVVEDN